MNIKLKQIFTVAVAVAMIAVPISATPEISFDGAVNINGTEKSDTELRDLGQLKMNVEAEVADGVNAKGILQFQEGRTTQFHEVHLTFDNIIDTLLGTAGSEMFNFSTTLGRQLIGFGREGSLYFHETQFVDKSLVAQNITGGSISNGEGVSFGFELPTPAPVNLSVGVLEDVKRDGNKYANALSNDRPTFTFRGTTELAVANVDLNIGLSAIHAKQAKAAGVDKGTDLSLGFDVAAEMDAYSFALEVATLKDDSESQTHKYYAATLGYAVTDEYGIALRYSGTKKDGTNPTDAKVISLLGTKQVSDTAKVQLQYNLNTDVYVPGSMTVKQDNNFQLQIVISLK
jgi:hypothetical protein